MAAVKTIKIKLEYDYWDADEARHAAGSVIELPEKQAAEMVNIGKAKLVVGD